jgi:hypothetical protein
MKTALTYLPLPLRRGAVNNSTRSRFLPAVSPQAARATLARVLP